MPKTKARKAEEIAGISSNLDKQKSMVFVDYKGLNVKEVGELRTKLRQDEGKMVVMKKTLLARAMKEKGIEVDARALEGQVAAVFAFGDTIAPLKTVHAFSKKNERLKIVGGYFENVSQSATAMMALANLPGRQELLGQMVGTMAAPLSGFLNVLEGNIKGLVVALHAMAQKNQ